jgi:Dna[CI] antecedent, DciA
VPGPRRSRSGRGGKAAGPKGARAVGELVAGALRDLGIPSMRLTRRVADAWRRAADPAWTDLAAPIRLVGGVLVVGVRSAALRQELSGFHRDRLLRVLQSALPDVPLVGIRFTAETRASPLRGPNEVPPASGPGGDPR